jgi:hypothetical protein
MSDLAKLVLRYTYDAGFASGLSVTLRNECHRALAARLIAGI